MACSMDMLSVIKMPSPKGPIPEGMKVTSLAGPNTLQPAPSCPALGVGGFTLWPMSYMDNRVSFGMVMYDPMWNIVKQVEKPGARYIYKITLNGSGESGSVTFAGQADQTVTMSLDEICQMLY
ncbi:MAG: hypothetical protein V7641_4854 [Blastocatellia bacterium]